MPGEKKYIALFCLLTIFVIIIPKELIHSFSGHKDTIDNVQNDNFKNIGITHKHCEMLKFETPIYHNHVKILLLPINFQSIKYIVNLYDEYVFFLNSNSLSRAPPK